MSNNIKVYKLLIKVSENVNLPHLKLNKGTYIFISDDYNECLTAHNLINQLNSDIDPIFTSICPDPAPIHYVDENDVIDSPVLIKIFTAMSFFN